MRKALSAVRRRIRLLRAAGGLFLGLTASGAFCLGLAAVSFFVPMERLASLLAMVAVAGPLLCAAAGALLPVSLECAARRADQCGLKERARTALELAAQDTPMARLQRGDALASLAALPLERAMPLKVGKKRWVPAFALALATGGLLMLPNPQHGVLRQRERARLELRAQAEAVERAAEAISRKNLTDEEQRELRRLTDELARNLREAKDAREALARLDERQRQLEALEQRIASRVADQTATALAGQQALAGLAQAFASGGEGLEAALSQLRDMAQTPEGSKDLAEQLESAAQDAPPGDVMQALASAAALAGAGNAQACVQALAGVLDSAGAAGTELLSLAQLARAGVAAIGGGVGDASGAGAGNGQGGGVGGASGTGAGGGAGRGTTQQDAGYREGLSNASGLGGQGIEDRVGAYERVYDPTRLGGDSPATLSAGEKGEGASQQAALGPGQGDYAGSVPYGQVIGEYQEAAARSMRRTALPLAEQALVTRYFDALVP